MCQALLCWPFFSIALVLCASFDIGIVHLHIYIYTCVCMRNLYWCEKCPCQIIYCAARFVLWTCMFLFLSRIQTPHPHIKGEYLFTCFAPAFQIYVYICTYVYTLEKHMKILRVYSNVFLRVISAATPHCQVHLRLPDWPRCRGVIVEVFYWSTYHQGPSGRLPWN